MAEFLNNAVQTVQINSPLLFNSSIPWRRGYVYHEDGTGNFILRGIVNNGCCGFARYQVTFNGNIAVPTGGVVGPIAVAITVNGEIRPTSTAIVTPAAVDEYNNVTSTAIITVPRGCCFNIAVRAVPGEVGATTAAIDVANSNLVINRVA